MAPLTLSGTGRLAESTDFAGTSFEPGLPTDASYRFNSYRLSYRYLLHDGERWRWHIGFTAKIRDAKVELEQEGRSASDSNVGFVPLLNFRIMWAATDRVDLLLEGDALAAPQGRAEDVIAGALVDVTESVRLRIGYRVVEGGADNDEVYNFALLNYASAGIIVSF